MMATETKHLNNLLSLLWTVLKIILSSQIDTLTPTPTWRLSPGITPEKGQSPAPQAWLQSKSNASRRAQLYLGGTAQTPPDPAPFLYIPHP